MGDDEVQIVSVSKSRRKRRRAATDDVEVVFVERLPSPELLEISRVELPLDDSVIITAVSETDVCTPSKKSDGDGADGRKTGIKDEKSLAKKKSRGTDLPAYWTKCEKCGSYERRYHLVDVQSNSHEWLNVCVPFLNAGFCVHRLSRIQNQTIWHRLEGERRLMQRTHVAGFDLNERLLYHTSRASTETICAEGLDQRLGGMGNFGRGIYFSDNPRKCDSYCQCRTNTDTRTMFACRVLLGDIKVYPRGQSDSSLVREPPKPGSKGQKTYDSVLGNIALNEFVVYNAYRVMPEYVIEYQVGPIAPQIAGVAPTNPHSSRPSLPMCHVCGDLTTICHCPSST